MLSRGGSEAAMRSSRLNCTTTASRRHQRFLVGPRRPCTPRIRARCAVSSSLVRNPICQSSYEAWSMAATKWDEPLDRGAARRAIRGGRPAGRRRYSRPEASAPLDTVAARATGEVAEPARGTRAGLPAGRRRYERPALCSRGPRFALGFRLPARRLSPLRLVASIRETTASRASRSSATGRSSARRAGSSGRRRR